MPPNKSCVLYLISDKLPGYRPGWMTRTAGSAKFDLPPSPQFLYGTKICYNMTEIEEIRETEFKYLNIFKSQALNMCCNADVYSMFLNIFISRMSLVVCM